MKKQNENYTNDPDALKNLLICSSIVFIIAGIFYSICINLSTVFEFLITSGNNIGVFFTFVYKYYQMIEYYLFFICLSICFILLCSLFKTQSKYIVTIKKLEICFLLFSSLTILSAISIMISLIIKFTENHVENIFAGIFVTVVLLFGFIKMYFDNASHYWKKKDLTQK